MFSLKVPVLLVNVLCLIVAESESFWKGIMDIGLLDPFVREIKTALDSMKNDLRRGAHFEGEYFQICQRIVTTNFFLDKNKQNYLILNGEN